LEAEISFDFVYQASAKVSFVTVHGQLRPTIAADDGEVPAASPVVLEGASLLCEPSP
jgi:hypothetical protein